MATQEEYENMTVSELKARLAMLKNEISTYDAMQNAFKIALNSLYGAQANAHFRYYDPNIAEGITLTGQCVIRFISNRLNDFMNKTLKTEGVDYVCANDTDSGYLVLNQLVKKVCPDDMPIQKKVDFVDRFSEKFIQPFLDQEFAKLADYLNCYENRFSMKREVITDKAIWRGKKNYIMQVWDNEGVRYQKPQLKAMGVETARSSTPKIVKEHLTKGYDILLNGTQDDLIKHVADFKTYFMKAPFAEIAFPRGVSDMDKWMDSVTMWKIGTPIHVKAAIMYNNLLGKYNLNSKFPEIRNGDKIRFIYLKEPNPTMNNAVAFFESIQAEFGLDEYVDRELQWDKAFLSPLKSFSNLVNMDTSKVIRLDAFFSDDDAVTTVALPTPVYHNPVIEAKNERQQAVVKTERVSTNNVSVAPKAPKQKAVKKAKPTLTSFFE